MLNPTKFLRLIDPAAEVNGARQVIALLPRLVKLAVMERQGATATQVTRESAGLLTVFGSTLREHAPLCWKRVPKRVSVRGKRARVLEYLDETAVLFHNRPRDVKGDPNGRVQIALIGSVAGKKPGVRETFAELTCCQTGRVHRGYQHTFGGTIVRKDVWRLAFEGLLALTVEWIKRLGDPELDGIIRDAKNTLLIEEVMES